MTMESSHQQDKKIGYEIRLQGAISQRWLDWFGNMTLVDEERSPEVETFKLAIEVADQAALLGQIQELHNLGYILLEFRRVDER